MHGRRGVLVVIGASILLLQSAAASIAAAGDGDVVLVSDTGKVTLIDSGDGEGTAGVTLHNQGATDLPVTAEAGEGAAEGCQISATEGSPIPSYRQQTVTLTFSADCGIDRAEGTNFTVMAEGSSFELHANPPSQADPDWVAVALAYVIAAAVALVILLAAVSTWMSSRPKGTFTWTSPLPGLSDSWKFSDSWAANATVVTALFAGVFGVQGAAEALLGESASKDVLAVAIVTAAASLGLTGLSPMLLQALRKRSLGFEEVRSETGEVISPKVEPAWLVTPLGLFVASLFTLTGTAGQLGSILWAVKETEFGQDWAMWTLGAVGAVGLAWYAWQTTRQSLDTGAKAATLGKAAETAKTMVDQAAQKQTEVRQLRESGVATDEEIHSAENEAEALKSEADNAVRSLSSVIESAQSSSRPSPIP